MMIPLLLCLAAAKPTFFSVGQNSGRSWFVAPSGQPMWSFAVDCVNTGDVSKPGNPGYDSKTLFPNEHAWAEDTATRLRSWGFNSLGGWCDTDVLGQVKHPLPYIEVLHLGAYDKAPWNDLFAPDADKLMGDAAHKLIPPHRNDPNLIGYCTDNELGWWDDTLFLSYFKFPASAPGKKALIASLRRVYRDDFAALKADWQTKAGDFQALADETTLTLKPGSRGIRAVHAFNFDLTSHYYALVRKLVKREDANHLILGDRYCQYYNLETAEASRPYTDVISTNGGADWLDGTYTHFMLDTLHRLTGKPVLITEFYFAARENQTGNRNSGEGFPTVQTQAERAKGFANCVHDLAGRPYMVGAHWFQFFDEPPKGRGDGEDFNMGMEDVKGRPYEAMVAAARRADPAEVHRRGPTVPTPAIPRAPSQPLKDSLRYWDRQRGYVPSGSREQWADLYAAYDPHDLYVGLIAMEFIDESLWSGGKMSEADRPKLTLLVNGHPISVSFNGKEKAACSVSRVELAEKRGLKHTLVLKIPTNTLLKPGQPVHIRAVLTSHGHGYTMTWDRTLRTL